MTYQLRDRPDGQIEIVVLRAETVGTFADRQVAAKVLTFLQEDDAFNGADAPAEEPPGLFGPKVEAEAATVVEELLGDLPAPAPATSRPPPRLSSQTPAGPSNLPAVVEERPRAPAQMRPPPVAMSEAQKDAAFQRIVAGEAMQEVARNYGVTFAQMRGMWTGYRRRLQKHFAAGGQVRCRQCQRVFMPSVSHPDTCARCSHD